MHIRIGCKGPDISDTCSPEEVVGDISEKENFGNVGRKEHHSHL